LLAEDGVVHLEDFGPGLLEVSNARLVSLVAAHGLEDNLAGDPRCSRIEVGNLHRGSLLEETVCLRVGGVGKEVGLVLDGEVTSDSAALVDEETVVLEDGDLAERLHFHESGRLVFTLHHVDGDQLEGNIKLLQDDGDTATAGGEREGMELEDHFER